MRYALRQLSRTPAFTAIAILTLAIGIATTTTIFAIVDELAFTPARGTGDGNVYHLAATSGGAVQIPDYDILAADPPLGVSAITAFDAYGGGLVQIPGRAERLIGWRVSGQYAGVHRVRAQVGRWIDDDDNLGGTLDPSVSIRGSAVPIVQGTLGADVVVISDRLWREWFDAAPDVGGRTIAVERTRRRIVGVAPPGFEPAIDVWVPFGRRRLLTREELERTRARTPPWLRTTRPAREPRQPGLQVLVRAAAGVSATELNDRLTAAVSVRPPSIESPRGVMRLRPRRGDDRLVSTGYTILGFAALVFVAACANLGNMLYARAMEREGELATRLALGATQRTIFALLFAETIVICAAAALAGMLLAAGALRLFVDAVPAFQVRPWQSVRLHLGLDWRVFGGASVAGAVAAVIVGAGSLWRSSRVSLLTRLTAAGPAVVARTEGRTLRTMLVAIQVTAAVLLLIATGILLENSSRQLDRRLLFDTDPLVAARIELPDEYDEARGTHFFDGLLERVRRIEGVSAAALADAIPAGEAPRPRFGVSSILAEPPPGGLSGRPPTRLDGRWMYVSPGFLQTLDLELTNGRDFDGRDRAGAGPVALVSETTARRLWPVADAVGKRLKCCGAAYLRTVVGVVPDPVGSVGTAQAMDVAEAMRASSDPNLGTYVFLPAAQHFTPNMLVVVRSPAPEAIVPRLRAAVAAIDPQVPVFSAGRVHSTQFPRASAERAVRTLAGALGVIALCIAMLGVFAVVSYFVSRRIREFGLRLALGASRGQIVKLVIDHSIHMVLIGLLPGVLFASLGTRYFQVELTKLRPNGLTVWVFVPLLMLAVGVLAACLPARRASSVDPNRALKEL